MSAKNKISIVVSVYNEEDVLETFYLQLEKELELLANDVDYEIIFVNDGSLDNSKQILDRIIKSGEKVKNINLSRNYGHEAAMLAGIDFAKGDAVICMDADLQHPPKLIPTIIEAFNAGYEVVMMVRISRQDSGLLRRTFNRIFYSTLNRLSENQIEPNTTDFFMVSNRVADVLRTRYRSNTRFIRGVVQNVGFRKKLLPFHAPERELGESKYSFIKLLRLAFSAFTTQTLAPLKVGVFIGLIFSGLSFILFIYSVFMWFYDRPVGGYTTLITFLSFGFAVLFILIGITGDYIGKIFKETKDPPIYLIEDIQQSTDHGEQPNTL